MLAQFGAIPAAVRSVAEGFDFRRVRFSSIGIVAAALLGGCIPTVPLTGADPADPAGPVAPVRYRSGVMPYTSLRPAAPSGWKEQNERVAPAPKSEQ
jgi:hypothetical protein